jgi:fibronectin type 3 domain-containing protein
MLLGRRGAHFGGRGPGARGWAAVTLAAIVLGGFAAGAAATAPRDDGSGAAPGVGFHTHTEGRGEEDVNVCSDALPAGQAHCLAHRRIDAAATARVPARPGVALGASATLGNSGAYDPPFLQSAYNTHTLSATAGAGETVAIVDAYDDPSVVTDLMNYRSFFGLPGCAGGSCLTKVNENGGTTYPAANSGWAQEISLDVDMVSAMCPNCNILLVEASSAYMSDLGTAVNTAVRLGAKVVSNSYGGSEYSSETLDSANFYDHPGVAVVASSGDAGYGVEFPAASNFVTAVGGTSLIQNTSTGTRNGTETAWSGAGSGCSVYEAKPTWQHDTGCADRTVADVSAVADPNTGVWVYDTYGTGGSWLIFGGTSVASPIIGSLYALAGNPAPSTLPADYPYSAPTALNDVTSGSNGSCGGSYLCTAGVGYDGPTGLGTPNGAQAFTATAQAPTAPSAPTALTATAGNATVTLNWSPPASNGGAAVSSYNVYRGTTSGSEVLLHSSTSATSFTDSVVTNGTAYFYEVTAVNSVSEGPRSAEVSATPLAPVPPAAPVLTATAGNGSASLSWTATAGSSGTYSVYRGTSTGTETLLLSGLSATSYTDPGLTNGAKYYYYVTAKNSAGTSGRSNEASVTPQASTTAPGAPILNAATSSSRGVVLTWAAPASNGGSAVTRYVLYRGRSSGQESTYVTLTCSSTCSYSYNDTNTRQGRSYYYQVAAVNVVGTGPRSNEASAVAR